MHHPPNNGPRRVNGNLRDGDMFNFIAFYTRQIDDPSMLQMFQTCGSILNSAVRIEAGIRSLDCESNVTTEQREATKSDILRIAQVYFEVYISLLLV